MKTENPITPVFGTDEEARVAPKYEMPEGMMPGEVAYQIVHDEAMLDGNSRLNLATFVTTWMDDYARKVMTENMDKNMIDKTCQVVELAGETVLHGYEYRGFFRGLYAGWYRRLETLAEET